LGQLELTVNVFNGSEKSTVEMQVDGKGEWRTLSKRNGIDPNFSRQYERELKIQPVIEPALTKPGNSTHLWVGKLPGTLKPGHHLITIRTTDMHGRTFTSSQITRVVAPKKRVSSASKKSDVRQSPR
jgi:hypothetical protein